MKRLAVHSLAEAEINDAVDYYEDCAERLGSKLLDEVEKAFDTILSSPGTWSAASGGCQRYMLTRFPYAVIYKDCNGVVEILAFPHNRRRPKYWVSRLTQPAKPRPT